MEAENDTRVTYPEYSFSNDSAKSLSPSPTASVHQSQGDQRSTNYINENYLNNLKTIETNLRLLNKSNQTANTQLLYYNQSTNYSSSMTTSSTVSSVNSNLLGLTDYNNFNLPQIKLKPSNPFADMNSCTNLFNTIIAQKSPNSSGQKSPLPLPPQKPTADPKSYQPRSVNQDRERPTTLSSTTTTTTTNNLDDYLSKVMSDVLKDFNNPKTAIK